MAVAFLWDAQASLNKHKTLIKFTLVVKMKTSKQTNNVKL